MLFRLLAITLTLISCAFAQESQGPDDFAGIPWNAHREEARSILVNKCKAVHKPDKDNDKLVFDDGVFANMPAISWRLHFSKGLFDNGSVNLKPITREQHEGLVSLLTTKYGKPTSKDRPHGYINASWHFPADPKTNLAKSITIIFRGAAAGKYHQCTSLIYKLEEAGKASPSSTATADDL